MDATPVTEIAVTAPPTTVALPSTAAVAGAAKLAVGTVLPVYAPAVARVIVPTDGLPRLGVKVTFGVPV
jgi:hypothetical protein